METIKVKVTREVITHKEDEGFYRVYANGHFEANFLFRPSYPETNDFSESTARKKAFDMAGKLERKESLNMEEIIYETQEKIIESNI